MTTAFQLVNLCIAHAFDQLRKCFALAKELFAVEAPIFGGKGLHLPIHCVAQRTHQGTGEVAGKQTVPVAAPHQFDDVPPRTAKQFF